MGLRFQPRTLLTLFFFILFAYVVYAAWDMPREAKLYPWVVGLIALALLGYQLVREIMPSEEANSRETGVDMDFTDDEATREGKRRALELFGWLYGFALVLWLLGFYISIPLMVFAYMLRHKESLVLTISLPAGTGLVTWIVFGHFLHLPFPPGIILEALGFD
ncbi:MAG: tripartite tricarboxylate transporter TctB family protein [Proteobacteria bacterium]|nr:tripartite tricarboxylate transporter TctB family protein [Pseudomonadota bacterium]